MAVRLAALSLAALLLLGPSPASAQAPAPAAPAGRIVVEPGLIFAQVRVNGRIGHFLVDTGAPTTVLDAGFAARSRLKLGQDQALGGGGGVVPGRIAEDIAVQAQGGPTLRLDPAVTDLSQIAAVFGRAFDGILGGDYFSRLALTLDYRTGHAAFAEPDAGRAPAAATRLRIASTPFIRAAGQIGSRRVEGSFQIDTGSNTAVSLYTPVARRAFPGVRGEAVATIGLGGHSRSRVANLDRFEVGGRTLADIPADFANDLRPDDAPGDFAGTIGGPAFAGRVLHLDYARALMWVE